MKEVLLNRTETKVREGVIMYDTPIFLMRNGKLKGLVVKEDKNKWILRIGGPNGVNGYHESRSKALTSGANYGYTYFIEE